MSAVAASFLAGSSPSAAASRCMPANASALGFRGGHREASGEVQGADGGPAQAQDADRPAAAALGGDRPADRAGRARCCPPQRRQPGLCRQAARRAGRPPLFQDTVIRHYRALVAANGQLPQLRVRWQTRFGLSGSAGWRANERGRAGNRELGSVRTATWPNAGPLLRQVVRKTGQVSEQRCQVACRVHEAQDLRRQGPRVIDQDIGERR